MSPDKAMIGYLQARIAELEAELAAEKTSRQRVFDRLIETYNRAEKAEAEVERLSLSAGKPRESDAAEPAAPHCKLCGKEFVPEYPNAPWCEPCAEEMAE